MSLGLLKDLDAFGWDEPDFDLLGAMTMRRYSGAHVEIFEKGIVREVVTHVDIKSMYPMVMAVLNLSPETVKLVALKPYTGQYIFSPAYIEVPDERLDKQVCISISPEDGVTRKSMIRFFEMRQQIRKEGGPLADSRQQGVKLIMNAIYGYNGMEYARYGSFLVAIVCTATGRFIINLVLGWLKSKGLRPLEVDTDGVYVRGVFDIAELVEFIRAKFYQFPLVHMLNLDAQVYDGMIVVKMKNYVIRNKGKNVFTGSGFHGRNMPHVAEQALEDFVEALFTGGDLFKTWATCVGRLVGQRVQDFEMAVDMNKNPEEYEETTMYAKLYAQLPEAEWGDEIRYVKTADGYVPLGVKPEEELLASLDAKYYEGRLKSVIERLLVPLLGTDRTVDEFHEAVLKKKKKERKKKI